MKRLTIASILALTLLSGCSVLPSRYDNNEYELIARLDTTVSFIQENCDDETYVKEKLDTLHYDARLLETYSFYIPMNTTTFEMAKIFKDDVEEMKAQYDKGAASPQYCNIKTGLMKDKIETALGVVGAKPGE